MSRLHHSEIARSYSSFQIASFLSAVIVANLLLMSACSGARQGAQTASGSNEWHEFQGTWTASGSRNVMRLEGERRASIANFNGSLVLSGSSRPNVAFRAEAIVFDDTRTGVMGRAVWTDEHGDQVFSTLQNSGMLSNSRILGTFTGGTGRYSGATGTYEFSWRFVLESDEGNLQGQSIGLKGRVRVDSSEAKS